MTAPGGEMPFLDHLEELRSRLLRSLLALVAGTAAGLVVVQRFEFVSRLKEPIAPYLQGGKLTVLSPTEPIMIVLKLGFVLGLLLASPVVIYQVWAFLAPALYPRERRVIVPALYVGVALFLTGAALSFRFLLPQALRVLFSFQSDALTPMITYDAYFDFVLQIVLAMGISFELPLVLVILASLGVVTPRQLNGFRRYAVVLACIAGAILSPGQDVLSMLMMTVPLLLLYEIGVAGSAVVHRRRTRRLLAEQEATAATLRSVGVLLLVAAGLAVGPGALAAQQPVAPPGAAAAPELPRAAPALPRDTTRRTGRDSLQTGPPVPGADTSAAARSGLPSKPSRDFPPEDSTMQALLKREGFDLTRFQADSGTAFPAEKQLILEGRAMTKRDNVTLEADSITYDDEACLAQASGQPRLFEKTQTMVGEDIRYDTCRKRGVIGEAFTNFKEGANTWYLRGNVSNDSTTTRIYAGDSKFTTCDLPAPHYVFSARKVKWVSNTILVARPIVVYIRDVPILWLPFIFQELGAGRKSGILIPQIGFADIVRPGSYQRQIQNIGYFWAVNDEINATVRLDWFSRRVTTLGVQVEYNALSRFMRGNFGLSRQWNFGGGSGFNLTWDHNQQLGAATTLSWGIRFTSNTQALAASALDPRLTTQLIDSRVNFNRRYRWGSLALGGSRQQNLNDGSTSQSLPTLTISPNPIDLTRNITWSPGLTVNNQTSSTNNPSSIFLVANAAGGLDTVRLRTASRNTSISLQTPFRIGGFQLSLNGSLNDRQGEGRSSVGPITVPPGAGTDTTTLRRLFLSDFETQFNFDVSFGLPTIFPRTWRVQPAVQIANVGSTFAVRNRNTGGDWVVGGKRLGFTVSSTPTLFAFLPGIFGLQRIRHSFAPTFSYVFNPASSVSEEFARAFAQPGVPLVLRTPAVQNLTVGMTNTFEAKTKPRPGDSTGTTARKFRLLSINTGTILSYDFEQAKLPGRTGFTNQSISNNLASDLLPNLQIGFGLDLWRGQVGTDSARFSPYLTNMQANLQLSGREIRSILALVGLATPDRSGRGGPGQGPQAVPTPFAPPPGDPFRPSTLFAQSLASIPRGQPFTLTLNYSLSRSRLSTVPAQQSLSFATTFSPSPFWGVSWNGNYNLTLGRFETNQIQLRRDLHEWEANFNFTRAANGNVAFTLLIALRGVPNLRLPYNQTTIER